MNTRWKENPIFLQVLLAGFLFAILMAFSYLFAFIQPSGSRLDLFARANSTRTSIALTSHALMGPFPTATGPTRTPSKIPSVTPTPTITPTSTPSPTPIRYFIDTATPRTLVPHTDQTSTFAPPASTSVVQTRTPRRPINTSVAPTNPPRQPTNPPQKPTKTSKPPKPTKTPKK